MARAVLYATASVAILLSVSGCASLFGKRSSTSGEGTPSFVLEVQAPDDVQDMLEQHLELKRFSTLPDLSQAEIRRLILATPKDAKKLLATEGYFNPSVKVSQRQPKNTVSENPEESLPTIVVQVETGEPTKVARTVLNFSGNIEDNPDPTIEEQKRDIRRSWALPFRRQFRQDDWQAAKKKALQQLTERHYLAGAYELHKATVDASKNKVALDLVLNSGPVYYFGQAKIDGTQFFDSTLVERIAQIPAGEAYSLDEALRAQQRLTESGYFSSAYVYVDPETDPQQADVRIQVQEAKRQKLVLGVGVSTDSGVRASIDHKHLSVPGIHWQADTKVKLDKRDKSLETELRSRPDKDLWRWILAAGVGRTIDENIVNDYYSAKVGRVKPDDTLDRSMFVQWNHSTLKTPEGRVSNSALTANYVLTKRAFNDRLFPTDGWGASIESGIGVAYGDSGNKDPFSRFKLRWQSYHPLGEWGLDRAGRIALRGQAGLVLAKPDAAIPYDQLFIIGGDNSVRGYAYRSIGVDTGFGVEASTHMVLGSVEWQRPVYIKNVPSDWESVLFFDTGSVADSFDNMSLHSSIGIGARWRSPIGPFQIDLGYGLKPRKLRWHLSIGTVF